MKHGLSNLQESAKHVPTAFSKEIKCEAKVASQQSDILSLYLLLFVFTTIRIIWDDKDGDDDDGINDNHNDDDN